MEILIFLNEQENHAITIQEGEIKNDDPRSFISSLREWLDTWMLTAQVDLIPNDISEVTALLMFIISTMEEKGMNKEEVCSEMAAAIVEHYHES